MSQTSRQAAIHRLRRGNWPARRRRVRPGRNRGRTGPGPGGLSAEPAGCHTADRSSVGLSKPGYRGTTGTEGPTHEPRSDLTTRAGQRAVRSAIARSASAISTPPPARRATPRRPGLSSSRRGPSTRRLPRFRPAGIRRSPARSTMRHAGVIAARPMAATVDRTGSAECTPRTRDLPFPLMARTYGVPSGGTRPSIRTGH